MSNKVKKLIGEVFFLCALLLTSCSSEKYMEKLEKAWDQVLASENSGQERKAVDDMGRLILETHGYFIIYLVSSDGRKVNLSDLGNQQIPFKTVQMDVYWGDDKQHFTGTNWIPKDKGNIDAFLLE